MLLRLSIVAALLPAAAGQAEKFQIDAGIPLYPEGIAYDTSSDTIILGSIGSPVLVTVDASSMALKTVKPFGDATNYNRCFGLHFDAASSKVWCSRSSLANSGDGAFVAYNLADLMSADEGMLSPVGEAIIQPATTNALDVDVSSSGMAYGTDGKGRVVSISSDLNTSAVVSNSTLLAPPEGGTVGANGIAIVSDTALVVANYGAKKLVRVDIATGDASEIATFETPVGPDGLLLLNDGRLAAVTYPFLSILEEVSGTDWKEAKVTEQVNLGLAEGEVATTLAQSEDDADNVYVTFVRFSEVLGGAFNTNSSMIAKVPLPATSPAVPAPGKPAVPAPGSPAVPAPGSPAVPAPTTPVPTGSPTSKATTPEPTSSASSIVVSAAGSLLLAGSISLAAFLVSGSF